VRLTALSDTARLTLAGKPAELRRVTAPLQLQSNTWHLDDKNLTVCFDLPKGKSTLDV
jgi:hypothetical protein